MFVLKGRSEDKEATQAIIELLTCRWTNMNPKQLKRMPFEDRQRLELTIASILEHKPQLLVGGIG